MNSKIFAIGFPIGFVALVAWVGNVLTMPEIDGWYQTLALPSWTPSGAVIGSVWTVLFILLAIAGILFLKNSKPRERAGFLMLYVLNGILNVGWSYLFFNQHNIYGAFVEIWFLNLTIVGLIYLLWRKHRAAAWLLVPYFLWVSFATYLNWQILNAL